MTKCYVGLGSSLGDRLLNLENAAQRLKALGSGIRVSPIYQTPALVPPGAPADWRTPYFNAAAEIFWPGTPDELLQALKKIEREMGRVPAPRWSPRVIDLDLLLFGDLILERENLRIPHAGLFDRSFVIDPMRDLAPSLRAPGSNASFLALSRRLPARAPLWMAILNLTPDSFSDGGRLQTETAFAEAIAECESVGAQIFDLGAESTRPGAPVVSAEEEWQRLRPALEFLQNRWHGKLFRPLLSLDTRRAAIASRALEMGVDWINDVSGGSDPAMADLVRDRRAGYVVMHSLSIPADPKHTLPSQADPVVELKTWMTERLENLARKGVPTDSIVFDPGIGFGKTAEQSYAILTRVREFADLPVRVLIGHSRKSFLRLFTAAGPGERDGESVGISLGLINAGADILRVHNPRLHMGAFHAWNNLKAASEPVAP